MENSLPDIAYLHAFNSLDGIGPRRLRHIQECFSSFREAWHAPQERFTALAFPSNLCDALQNHRRAFDVSHSFKKLCARDISCVSLSDDRYPRLLKEIPDPPSLLYVRGNLRTELLLSIGIVGTRRATPYGKEITYRFASRLAQSGVWIISGLARGIDGIAHTAAIEMNGYTIAILGSGVDRESIYPRVHVRLAERIIENGGAIISEFPPGTNAQKAHFPMRNRIIAGLSHGILVTEAPEKSGAMISAFHALDYNREVFAVPGPITARTSSGTNRLIRMGAVLASNPDDIFEEFSFSPPARQANMPLETGEERRVLELLEQGPLHVDALAAAIKCPVSSLQTLLTLMEMSGRVRHLDRGVYGKTQA